MRNNQFLVKCKNNYIHLYKLTKIIIVFVCLLSTNIVCLGQNLQLHYDARHTLHSDNFSRNFPRLVFEMFKPDKWGQSTVFIRSDFSAPNNQMGMAFLLLARDIVVSNKSPVMLHLEFTGGLAKVETTGLSIPNAYMIGLSYERQLGSLGLSTYLVYRYNSFEKASHDMQWTALWEGSFFSDRFSVQGWLNVWTENKIHTKDNFESGKYLFFLWEQQFWYNFSENFSIGGQVEFSNNFYHNEVKAFVNPTIATRWTF